MQGLIRSAAGLGLALVLALGASAASAADRKITLLPGTDLPGFDYSTLKGVSLDECQKACVDDDICRAFTFNEKAGWCFLKGAVADKESFKGATSGTVELSPRPEVTAAVRQAELPFPADDVLYAARRMAETLADSYPAPEKRSYAQLVEDADEAAEDGNPDAALLAYQQALGINGNDPQLWLRLAQVALDRADEVVGTDSDNSYDLGRIGTSAALNAFLRLQAKSDRAAALAVLAHGLEYREMWRESIATYRLSLALADNPSLAKHLEQVVAEHGFRVTSNEVDSEAADPRICAVFSDPLPSGKTDLSKYVVVEGASRAAVETERNQICITGVEHGKRYAIKLRAGLPSADGETLRKDVAIDVFVPDRSAFVGFANNAYVMPKGLGGGLPITSINAKAADVVIYRIGDRAIAATVRDGIFQDTLTGYSAEDVANQYGQQIWQGQVDLAEGAANAMVTTAIPVSDALKTAEPGAYVVTARVANAPEQDYWDTMATQWFIITDLGLTTVSGDDGVHAFVRSLDTAEPVAGAHVRLVAVNNNILGETVTDADGRADFAPGLARGQGGQAPQLLVAETDGGDYAFLDVTQPAFDLTDRGVEGRPSPGPLDVFATTERGVYRPGETVFFTALLRDAKAKAVTDLPLTMQLERPDGVVARTDLLDDQGAGSYLANLAMDAEAMRGSWHIRLYADPKGEALSDTAFLVEDFEPERLAFEISAAKGPVDPAQPAEIDVAAKYLYGANAPDLSVEADVVMRPVFRLDGYPGYTFGRLDDNINTDQAPMGVVATTDADGDAKAEVPLPVPQQTTRPIEAQFILRLIDSNGRPVERTLTRPVLAPNDRIGIKPTFAGKDLGESAQAGFDVVVVSPEGQTVDKKDLAWTLSRLETTYQWYRESDGWKWEAITTSRQVANGTIDATASGPVTVTAPVDWGRYRFEVESSGAGAHSSTYEFYAGYYYAEPGSNTPDTLDVALDKPAYRPGDTAHLKLDPQFAGTALVMVVDNRIIDMKAVEVPEGGITVDLPVTEEWGPGAYVTATLYRPSNVAAKRMPARALGLAFADVDPGDLKLDVGLDLPKEASPRQPLEIGVDLGNLAAGQTAYVAVAAVDLGILNLTNFQVPDPDGWYFGQRQLGMDFRDLYGRMIDPTQGLPGNLRVGGDGGGTRLGTPPATSVLVALHSGIVKVDADGKATISFDMPDFNGTVRVMAMAWTESAVGHASADVVVHDPVVVNLSPPRFMRLGDESRLLVEIDNVSGPAGTYKVELATGPGIDTQADATDVELDAKARATLSLGLTATGLGDQDLALTVTPPEGEPMVKHLKLGVRPISAPQTESALVTVKPGESLVIDESRFDGLVANTGTLTLGIGSIAKLGVPELMLALDRYPYGCAEQVASRVLPLLYLNDVAQTLGLGSDQALDQRIRDAIADLLSKQGYNGSFGLWGPFGNTDLWLDSYITDFLLRAKAKGYVVPQEALDRALDSLGNQVSYAADFTDGGEDIAYALYDLARAGRAAIGDLRYYLETHLDAFATPLAKAQIGAALALYGDTARAATAFEAAVDALKTRDDPNAYRPDYGSRLRDLAGVLALAAEFKPTGIDLASLTGKLATLRNHASYTSTQEDAWTLLAAAALAVEPGTAGVTLDGKPVDKAVFRTYEQGEIAAGPVTIANDGAEPLEVKVSVTGYPVEAPAADGNGFAIERTYYRIDGTEIDPTSDPISQNDRFVVVLHVDADTLGSGQYLLADPLPAGFEIENPDLTSGGLTDLGWLRQLDYPSHVEARTDQYVAAFSYVSQTAGFTTAYVVRAISPGHFVLPGATVEDMYRPEHRANTDAATIEVGATGP